MSPVPGRGDDDGERDAEREWRKIRVVVYISWIGWAGKN